MDRAAVAKLQAKIDRLSKQIDQGAEKLLAAPASLTDILTAKLQGWQNERESLQQQLHAQQAASVVDADVSQGIEDAIAELETLRQRLHETDPGLLRDLLRQFVAKVEVWFDVAKGAKRFKSVPRLGLIHLRPDLKIFQLVAGVTSLG